MKQTVTPIQSVEPIKSTVGQVGNVDAIGSVGSVKPIFRSIRKLKSLRPRRIMTFREFVEAIQGDRYSGPEDQLADPKDRLPTGRLDYDLAASLIKEHRSRSVTPILR